MIIYKINNNLHKQNKAANHMNVQITFISSQNYAQSIEIQKYATLI